MRINLINKQKIYIYTHTNRVKTEKIERRTKKQKHFN